MDPRSVLFYAVAVSVCILACTIYISLQSEVSARSRTVAQLESTLEDIEDDNTAQASGLSVNGNILTIKEQAVEELGMHKQKKSQVVYYDISDSDYVLQYQEISG